MVLLHSKVDVFNAASRIITFARIRRHAVGTSNAQQSLECLQRPRRPLGRTTEMPRLKKHDLGFSSSPVCQSARANCPALQKSKEAVGGQAPLRGPLVYGGGVHMWVRAGRQDVLAARSFSHPPPFSRLLSNPQAISFTVFSCSGVGVYLQIRASSPILTRAKTPLPGSQCIDTYPLSNSKPSSRRAD